MQFREWLYLELMAPTLLDRSTYSPKDSVQSRKAALKRLYAAAPNKIRPAAIWAEFGRHQALTLELANAMLDDRYVRPLIEVPAGQSAMLDLTDAGTGTSQELLEGVFDPFFTMKSEGKGHGTTGRIYVHRSLRKS